VTAPGASAPAGPDRDSQRVLIDEFRRYARYLAGTSATDYQVERWLDFHRQHPPRAAGRFDRLLLALARTTPGLHLADAYSGTLHRNAAVRSRLALALAILESSPPSFAVLDAPDRGGTAWVFIRLSFSAALAAVTLLAAAVLLGPLHLVMGGGTHPRGAADA
jgi:hypothetical protein